LSISIRELPSKKKMAKIILLDTLIGVASAIYPDDHWTYSTKLSNAMADDFIKENVDAGKTVSYIGFRFLIII